ncbi:MAG: hypothetical protein K0R38_54 [Polyangiaceae bacterium]|jgi:hypothetical protein|nr:hypothetical protein [Polyangiaceae bacterium]
MKPIVVQLARLFAALAVLYGVLLALSLVFRPSERGHARLDSSRAAESLYLTEPKYVFFSRSRLNTEQDKILVLGASNALVGFKQRELQAALPEREVHNVSVSGSNITQMRQVVELVQEVQTPAAREHNTFVLGLWYGVFASNRARWETPDRHAGDTDIDLERYRYGFYRRGEHGAEPLLPPSLLDTGGHLVHPYLALDALTRDATRSLRERLSGKPRKLTDAERNERLVGASEQAGYLAFWRKYMGNVERLEDAPFQILEKTVDDIVRAGGQVVLVDMPIPSWHAAGSPLYADYSRRMETLLPELAARERVRVVRIAGSDNGDFSDEVHPKPRVTALWSETLASALVLPEHEREQNEHRSPLRQADAGISRRIR